MPSPARPRLGTKLQLVPVRQGFVTRNTPKDCRRTAESFIGDVMSGLLPEFGLQLETVGRGAIVDDGVPQLV